MPFRPESKYDLSELLDAVKERHGSVLKKADKAAKSWAAGISEQAVAEMTARRASAMIAQESETWAINALVHNNEWVTMSIADFTPVVEAWITFRKLFTCDNPNCESLLRVVGKPGSEEAFRCDCARINLNLRPK